MHDRTSRSLLAERWALHVRFGVNENGMKRLNLQLTNGP
jgi:hypothetical protein